MIITQNEHKFESEDKRGETGGSEKEQNTNLVLGSRSTNPAGSTC